MKRTLLLLSLLVAVPLPGRSENVLQNGGFTSDLSPWMEFTSANGTVEWSAVDVVDDPASGSLLVTNTSTDPIGHGKGVMQRAPAIAGKPYMLKIRAYVPAGQVGIGYATAEVQFWASSGAEPCSTPLWDWRQSNHLGNDANSWGHWETLATIAVAPPGATCALVVLETYRPHGTADGTPFQAYFDDIELNEMLFVDGFESGSLGKWEPAT